MKKNKRKDSNIETLEIHGKLNFTECIKVIEKIMKKHPDVERTILGEFEGGLVEDKVVFCVQLVKLDNKKIISVYAYEREPTFQEIVNKERARDAFQEIVNKERARDAEFIKGNPPKVFLPTGVDLRGIALVVKTSPGKEHDNWFSRSISRENDDIPFSLNFKEICRKKDQKKMKECKLKK